MKSIEVEGATVEAATALALSVLSLEATDAVIEVLSGREGDSTSAKVRVRVTAKSAFDVSQETPSPTSAASAPSQVTPVRDSQTVPYSATKSEFPGKQAVIETFSLIVSKLGISPTVEAEAPIGEEGFTIKASGDGAALIIGRHGETLEAIEYLLNRIAGGSPNDAPRINLDVEGYRERREASLQELAKSSAEQVVSSGRPAVLQPMSPRDRRIVHLALQEDGRVSTHSEGNGPFRTLVVTPRRNS